MIALNEAEVLDRFALLAGFDAGGAEPYRTLCQDAMAEISRGERAGCGPEASGPLAAAAAALACYRLALIRAGQGADAFRAGDLSITPGKADSASARGVWCEAVAAASPYLEDVHFLFRRTGP